MPRPSNTAQRRAQIVEGLLRLLPAKGYAQASVSAIAREAGLAPGLVHYHFEGKQKILVAATRELAARLEARFAARIAAATTDRGRIDAWIDAHLAVGPDGDGAAVAAWAAVGAEAQRDPDVAEVYSTFLRADRDRLAGLLGPLVPDPDLDAVATSLVALVEGLYRAGVGAPGFVPPGTAVATVRPLVDALLGAKR